MVIREVFSGVGPAEARQRPGRGVFDAVGGLQNERNLLCVSRFRVVDRGLYLIKSIETNHFNMLYSIVGYQHIAA